MWWVPQYPNRMKQVKFGKHVAWCSLNDFCTVTIQLFWNSKCVCSFVTWGSLDSSVHANSKYLRRAWRFGPLRSLQSVICHMWSVWSVEMAVPSWSEPYMPYSSCTQAVQGVICTSSVNQKKQLQSPSSPLQPLCKLHKQRKLWESAFGCLLVVCYVAHGLNTFGLSGLCNEPVQSVLRLRWPCLFTTNNIVARHWLVPTWLQLQLDGSATSALKL